jgi:4-amino-4-deoxy-L-arabinose transferase-like glycosyltransferase
MNFQRSALSHVKRLSASLVPPVVGANIVSFFQGHQSRPVRLLHMLAKGRTPLLLFALFSFLIFLVGLGSAPIQLWDESRQAVNAMEMYLHGLSLVTTYEFLPDHINTKPPLLIWLMNLTMDALGPSEFALRLPSALAAAATVCIVVYFCWRVTRSAAWSLFAGALMVGSRVFIGVHAAATGDYDALLTFFTTAYLALLFFALHREKPKFGKVLLAALCVSAAALTKGLAGLIPGVGIPLYLLLLSRWRRVLTIRYLIAGLIGLLPIVAYYVYREHVDPGYIAIENQYYWLGRYASAVEGHTAPPYMYLSLLMTPPEFIGGVLILLLPFGLEAAKGRNKVALVYATVVAAAIVSVYSTAATKLWWYIIPAVPWLAVAVTLSTRAVLQVLKSIAVRWERMARAGLLLVAAMCLTDVIVYRLLHSLRNPIDSQAMYGALLKELYDRGERTVNIQDGGVQNLDRYAPQLRYYTLYWRQHGFNVQLLAETEAAQPGDLIATCDPNERAAVASIKDAVPLLQDNNCLAVKVASMQ